MSIAAGAAVVLILAVVVPLLVFGRAGAPDGQPALTNTTLQASVPQSGPYVLRGETLELVVSLAVDLGVYRPAYVPPGGQNGNKLVQEALGSGILLASEGPDYRLNESMTIGEFAVWVWRAFGSHLSVGEPEAIPGLKNLPEEEQRAISSLVQAGIVSVDPDGQFHAANPLTAEQRSRILGLIADYLGF